ncbi:hypothetical protein [Rufibacter soli]
MERTDEHGNPVPFSLIFCTCNREKKTGGEVIELPKAVLLRKKGSKAPNLGTGYPSRLILDLNTDRKYQVHIRLIDQFNGTPVVW